MTTGDKKLFLEGVNQAGEIVRYAIISLDREHGTITLLTPRGGTITEPYSPETLKSAGYRLVAER